MFSQRLTRSLLSKAASKSSWQQNLIRRNYFPRVVSNRPALARLCRSAGGCSLRFSSTAETREFQAETRKLLDIVTHSIYTDKDVFIRELISNASDALEKYRYKQVTGEASGGSQSSALEINVITDPATNTLIITDNGIGMSKEDLISNLGTIARSGSKQFLEQLKSTDSGAAEGSSAVKDSIIGQFGVGFYSSFMVADSVTVESLPFSNDGGHPYKWSSDGSGTYSIEEAPDSELKHAGRGTRITMKLKESCKDFAQDEKIKSIVKRYSNFVSFPIKLNGESVNTVSAIWTKDKSELTEAQYEEFYKYIANAYDKPKFTLHFRADAPIDLKVLLYIPSFHTEKFGMGRMEPGVNLYSRKILIESKPKDLLPEWLRFVKGVVDSEDLPLSIAREKSQDSTLLKRIRDVLTRKVIRFLDEQARNHPDQYREFYAEFSFFLKEGVCHDYQFMDQLSKLLLFESSAKSDGELVSLDDYISRCTPEQKQIYYLVAPSREAALSSPYYEVFRRSGKEVLLLYNTIDDFVMSNIRNFGGRELVSAESSSVNLGEDAKGEDKKTDDAEGSAKTTSTEKLSEAESAVLCDWLKSVLGPQRVREVKTTSRLADSPALITDHESGALRRMMKILNQANTGNKTSTELPPQVLEINPSHPMIVALAKAQGEGGQKTTIAEMVAQQMFDNSLIAAGLIDDPRSMISRLNDILVASLTK